MDYSFFIFLSSGLFLGWSLGANDAANIFGTAVGTKMVRFRTAAVIASVFVMLGAVFSGGGASTTLVELGAVNAIAGFVYVRLRRSPHRLLDGQQRHSRFHLSVHRRRDHRLELLQRKRNRLRHSFPDCQHLDSLPAAGRHYRHFALLADSFLAQTFAHSPAAPGQLHSHCPYHNRCFRRLCLRLKQHRQCHGRFWLTPIRCKASPSNICTSAALSFCF